MKTKNVLKLRKFVSALLLTVLLAGLIGNILPWNVNAEGSSRPLKVLIVKEDLEYAYPANIPLYWLEKIWKIPCDVKNQHTEIDNTTIYDAN